MQVTRLNKYPKLHMGLCGLVVALVLVALPMPTWADGNVADTSTAASQASSIPTDTTSALSETADNTTSTLQTAVSAEPLTSVSLVPNEPVADNEDAAPTASMTIANTISSDTTSGSATVIDNTEAGDATSGDAAATATVLNIANANGLTAGNFTLFECDVTGDVQDNLVVDPTSLLPICETTHEGATQQQKPTQNLQAGASLVDILNDIVLSASSGDATVSGNSQAGDATSGDAAALANIVNIANTAIGAKNSFLGVINIYGNLKGDILVPQSLVDSLINPNAGSGVPVGTTTIANSIEATANSGEANVKDNNAAGDATSGDAATSLTILNLTGQEVVAKNSLLVFVNVLGKWMGMIVPAPGSNTAMLGSEVRSSSAANINGGDTAGDSTTNISNNVSVKAQSGQANVTNNTDAGNATSGKAQAGVNLLNITHSNFLLDDWFGALFINVLGSWLGDFDIQRSAPTTAEAPSTESSQPIQDVRVFQFAEPATVTQHIAAASSSSTTNDSSRQTDLTEISTPTGTVLSSKSLPEVAGQSTPPIKAVKLDLFALAATVMALTVLVAAITMIFRRWHAA